MGDLIGEYYRMGCVSVEDVLEMASSHGPVALEQVMSEMRESSGREHSTGMVVVPGEPPGKNTCAFIRKITAERSKMIVVAQGGSLQAGAFESMLRASMPDLEKKLRVVDGGGSLANAVNSAERNRHYRPNQALEVFCDQQAARGFAQEIRDGSLKFDPTVITVTPQTIPTDDLEAIRSAVKGNDLAAMHRVLDSHIFSSQQGIQDYRAAMFSGPQESVVREFLTDLHDDEETAKGQLVQIVKDNRNLLASRGIQVKGAKYLGTGSNGSAWQLADGNVLKVTTDDAEAHVAAHIKGKQFKHIFTIHDVWAFPGQYNGHHVYGLLTEGGLVKPSDQDRNDFNWMVGMLEMVYEDSDKDLWAGEIRKVLQGLMDWDGEDWSFRNLTRQIKAQLSTIKPKVLGLVKKFGLAGMMADMKKLGYAPDLHAGNFMQRPDGTYVIIDIGTGGDQESQKPPFKGEQKVVEFNVPSLDIGQVNEFGIGSGSPGSGMNGSAQMRGSNSSAWSGGMQVLVDPDMHVPEDDNESERTGALDQDIRGGGLDWGGTRVGPR